MVYSGALCIFIVRQGGQGTFIFGNENLSLYRFIKMWLLIWELFKVAQAETGSKWEHMYNVII